MSLISLNSAFLMTASWCGGVAPLAGGQREGGGGGGRGKQEGAEGRRGRGGVDGLVPRNVN